MGMPPIFPVFPPVFSDGKGAGVNESANMVRIIKAIYFLLLSSSVSISRGLGCRIPKIRRIITIINHPGL
jgi:hypothetical protein